ncbi:MAG TPA: hypothetical protein VF459_03060 [Caulobacteraceae bacterium]
MHRRLFLTAMAAALPTSVWAAQKDPVKLAKAFPYLDVYLKMPSAQRSRFSLVYYMLRDGKPAGDLHAWIVDGAARTPLALDHDGRVLHPPTLAQISGDAMLQFDVPADAVLKPRLELHAAAPVAAQIDAADLQLSINQAGEAVKKIAGPMSFAAPKITAAQFPGGVSGKAALPDGRAFALAPGKFGPLYDPAKEPGAKTIILAKAPSRILLTPSA